MRDLENMKALQNEVNPDFMGLIFHPLSPRYVDAGFAGKYASINIPKVGVFVNESLDKLVETKEKFNLSGVQLHGSESVSYVKKLRTKTDVFVWKVWSVKNSLSWAELDPYEPFVDAFLFDTFSEAHGGSGKVFNWQILDDYPFSKPFFLSGGLGLEHAVQLQGLKEYFPQLSGVDLNSKFELSPGLKDTHRLLEFKNRLLSKEIN